MEKTKDEKIAAKKALLIIAFLLLGLFLVMCIGCAHGEVKDEHGKVIMTVDTHGFGRDTVFCKKLPDGSVLYYSSQSNIAGVLGEINKTIGTAAGVARDAMP